MNKNQFTVNTKIIGESFFTKLPKDPMLLESDFVRMDKSIIWKFNYLFWKHYTLWEETYGEHYEASLPSGISESHRQEFIEKSAEKFMKLLENLDKKKKLPEIIYLYEQGPGTGLFAKGFLDYIQAKNATVYRKLQYIISDISDEILASSLQNLGPHKNQVKAYTQEKFEKNLELFINKILFARHSNMWDEWPCRLVQIRRSGLADVYIRAICDRKYSDFAIEIQKSGLENTILEFPTIWKEFFRNITLQTRSFTCSDIDIQQSTYLQYLQKSKDIYAGKNTLLSEFIFDNLSFLNTLIDWERGGYIEIVDIMTQEPQRKMYPRKFDGAIGYKIDGKIVESWCNENMKTSSFEKLRKSNMVVTITNT